MSFPKFVNMTKNVNTPFLSNFARFLHSWKTTLITWFFFYEDDNQLQIQVPPGSGVTIFMIAQLIASTGFQSKQNIADWTSKHVIYFSPFNNWLSTEEKGRRKIGRRRRCDGVSWGGGRQSNSPPPAATVFMGGGRRRSVTAPAANVKTGSAKFHVGAAVYRHKTGAGAHITYN